MVGTQLPFDAALELCADTHRRIVLAELVGREAPITIDALTESIVTHNHHAALASVSDETVTGIRTSLLHSHLPKLAEAGLVEYGPQRGVVVPTADLSRGEPHLAAILDADPALETPLEP